MSEERSLTAMVEGLLPVTKQLVLDQGSYQPMLFVFGEKNMAILALAVSLPDVGQERYDFFRNLGAYLAQQQGTDIGAVEAVIHVTEAWMRKTLADEKLPYRHLENDPQRIEVLILSGWKPSTEECVLRCLEMQRNSEGTLVAVEDYDLGQDVMVVPYTLQHFVEGYNAGLTNSASSSPRPSPHGHASDLN